MKIITALLLASSSLVAAPLPNQTNTTVLLCTMVIDTNILGGLTPSDFATNCAVQFVSSPDITIPTNLWPIVATVPCTQLLPQGPPGTQTIPATVWTNPVPTDGATRFWMMRYTNLSNGGVGPFSQAYPMIWLLPKGQTGARLP